MFFKISFIFHFIYLHNSPNYYNFTYKKTFSTKSANSKHTMELDNFLAGLKRQEHRHTASSRKTAHGIFFMISRQEDGTTWVTVVDSKMQRVVADYRDLDGDESAALRSMEHISERDLFRVEWGTEASGESHINLSQHPQLLYQLIRCNNLVGADGMPIHVSQESTMAIIRLNKEENGEKTMLRPALSLATTDSEGQTDGNSDEPMFLSDCFALAGHTLYPTAPLGDNYAQLKFFLAPINSSMAQEFLSVLYSYIDNIKVIYEGYTIERQEQEVKPLPTLLFEKVDTDHTLYLRLVQQLKGLSVDFTQRFDVNTVASLTDDHRIVVRRVANMRLEEYASALRQQIVKHAPSRGAAKQVYYDSDYLFIIPEAVAGPFLLSALPQLLSDYHLIGADKLRDYKVQPVQPKLNVSLSSGIDFLEGSASVNLAGEQFTLGKVLEQYTKKRYVELSDGNRAIIDDGYMRRLERIFSRKKGKDGGIKVSFFDLPEIEELLNHQLEGEVFRHHREVYEGFNQLAKQTLKTTKLKATLRPYQQEGIKWMKYLYDNNLGGCLADDMGLGKTVQTIGLLTLIYPKVKAPTLIIMPRSLLFNWQNELRRFAPQLSVYTYYANERDLDTAMTHQVVLTTYAITRNDIEQLRHKHFHMAILDESQNIKNAGSQTTQATLLLKADHRMALSGTPIENNLTELYSLFRFLNPTMFGTADDFNARYTYPIQRDDDKDALNALRRKIFPFMLRRLKRDVLKDLPDRIEQTLYVEMSAEQADFYERRRQYYYEQVSKTIATEGVQKSQFVMFQALSELRRIASVPESLSDGMISSPKLEQLMDAVEDAVENGHKVVVFFNFIAGLELAGEQLEKANIDFCSMTGSTRDRRSIVERFQSDQGCRVMLMTLKTGGVGLNLTAADTVFIFEPWWNKAAEEQAINRLHRFGQKSNVLSYSLITKATIEEKIQLLQQQKADLFDGLISADSSSAKHLSEEDIKYILG